MSWSISLDGGKPLRVTSGEGIKAAVAGILMGSGLAPQMAETFGRAALQAAQQYTERRRTVWSTTPLEYAQTLADGRVLWVRSDDLPEDPTQQCRGLDSDGNRCGRSLNHVGEC